MNESQKLERIVLEHQAILLSRRHGSSAMYYHWHQCVEFLYVSSGYGIVVVDNQSYTVRPGRMFIFPPFRLHKVHVNDSESNRYHRTSMHIEQSIVTATLQQFPRFQRQLSQIVSDNALAQAYDLSEHMATLESILNRFSELDSADHYRAEDVTFLVMQILALLPHQVMELSTPQYTAAASIMQWVEAHYSEKFSLDTLARDIGFSRSYTSRIFRQQTGGSIHEYLLTRRIKRSCDLLRTGNMGIDAIAAVVGFSDVTYFITCFRKMMQQTPLQYRKQGRLSADSLKRGSKT